MARIRRPLRRDQRLLVVDDDPELLRSTGRLLRSRGYDVRMAADGPGALAAARDDAPDAILLDWYLAESTAEALVPALREIAPSAKVLIVSGWAGDEPWAALVLRLGVGGFHDKGDGAVALLDRIEALLESVPESPC